MKKIRVNMVSESDITVQGHGVHTAYVEMAQALERRPDVALQRGGFGKKLDVDIIHLHTIGFYAYRKLLQRGPKKVVSAHIVPASLVGSIILAKVWLPLAARYMRWFYGKADVILAVSGTVARILHEDLRIPKEKIQVFYNTINMSRYNATNNERREARKKLNVKNDAFVVVGNGQVQPRKRLDIFVRMAKALPDVEFIWVGGIPFKQLGADYAEMQKLIASAPKNLTITGVIPHEDVRDFFLVANVFCLPAEQENHPMCVLEAASASLPIVLRDIPEYNDTFGDDAIRCQDDDFVAAITSLRDAKKYKVQQEKTAAIAERFDSSEAAERLVALYNGLIKR